jgi:peptidoglycan hydrolase-like protein with peptidoglycan-binding domain
MHPIIIHRVATTAVLPLVAAGGWAGYTQLPQSYPAPTAICTTLATDLSLGANSYDVGILQTFLVREGYLRGAATSYFGQATWTALTRFQADHGLAASGKVDGATRDLIERMTCGGRTTRAPAPAHTDSRYDRSYQNVSYAYDTPAPSRTSSYRSNSADYTNRGYSQNDRAYSNRSGSYGNDGRMSYGNDCGYASDRWSDSCGSTYSSNASPYGQQYYGAPASSYDLAGNFTGADYYGRGNSSNCAYDRNCAGVGGSQRW